LVYFFGFGVARRELPQEIPDLDLSAPRAEEEIIMAECLHNLFDLGFRIIEGPASLAHSELY
jgi:hypothetical protein